MRFDVITLFPDLFAPHLAQGITRRAFESRQVDVRLWPLRDFAPDSYRRVDDRPFGGGPGMVMMAEPLARCLAQGAGVETNLVDAAKWHLIAKAGGLNDEGLEKMLAKLSKDDRSKAEKAAADWRDRAQIGMQR